MSGWTWAWVLWGLAFAVIEGAALINKEQGDTLSEHLRKWFNTGSKAGRWAWLVTAGVFFAWFVTHIAVQGSV